MTGRKRQTELDGLRLIGLGRVPACGTCPRYRDLVARFMDPAGQPAVLAPVPGTCEHAYCTPLAERYGVQKPVSLLQRAVG